MKILIVCSGKPSNPKWSFELTRSYIYEQIESIKDLGVEYDTYFIEGKGIIGYLKNYKSMLNKIKEYKPDLIHAHYGLSGLLANLQRKIPVVTTFHGSDINLPSARRFSYFTSRLSSDTIFVHTNQPSKIDYKKEINLIPCGIDTTLFYPIEKDKAKKLLNLKTNQKYGLFTSSFQNSIKNYPLAKKAIEQSKYDIELIELKEYTREEVALLLNAVEFLLMTSFTEGSPLIIKEAMACNCPIVSVDVGDVKDALSKTNGSSVTSLYDANELAQCINRVIQTNQKTNAREKALQYDLINVAKEVLKIYQKTINKGNVK